MADTATSPVAETGSSTRPQKPDEAQYKIDLEKAEKEHAASQTKFNAIRAKVDDARSGRTGSGKDRWKELVDEQKEIRNKQSSNKSSRTGQQEKYNANEATIKKLIAQQKDNRTKLGFKDEKEIDDKIARLMKDVDSGSLAIVDEKKNLAEVSNLRRLKKQFGSLDELNKQIDDKKAENVELKKTFDNAESRSLAETYEKNQKELDEIKASRDNKNKGFESLKAEREEAYAAQQEKFKAIRELKDKYYGQKKAYKAYEDEVYKARREKQDTERKAYEKEKRRKIADQRLEEASSPAFLDEILTAEGLIRHFDPTYSTSSGDKGPGEYAASAQRTVDESAFKGMKVSKKEEEDFFVGSGGKKKGKKGTKAAAPEKFNMNIGIIEQLGKVGVEPPSSQEGVPAVVEQLKTKVANWKKEQDSQTQKNIEKAKAEIERLETEVVDTPSSSGARTNGRRQDRAKKVSQKDAGDDAEAAQEQEKDAAADVAEDLKAASIEDKEAEATA